jgi:hypothetical protein
VPRCTAVHGTNVLREGGAVETSHNEATLCSLNTLKLIVKAFMTMAVIGPSDTLRHWVPADLKHTKGDANRPVIRGWGGKGDCVLYDIVDGRCNL